jgi:hypothetical protein
VRLARYLIAAQIWVCPFVFAQGKGVPTFGTTVVVPGGLVGSIYNISPLSAFLPDFQELHPVGRIYTSSLNVPLRYFHEGFPGVTNRFEWFAIDYSGRFWIEKPGLYRFELASDDGSRLYIDDRLVVNNDGIHSLQTKTGEMTLAGGIHRIRVSYFQGPRDEVALILKIGGPDADWRVFSTDEFKPPPNPETWAFREADTTNGLTLRISSAAGSPGDDLSAEVLFESRPRSGTVALKWELIVPAQLLEPVGGGPETGPAAIESGKSVTCSMKKSYVYSCSLAGGQKPMMTGTIAVFHFKIRTTAVAATTALRIERAMATTMDSKVRSLSNTEATVVIK